MFVLLSSCVVCGGMDGKMVRFSLYHYLENYTSSSAKFVPMWSPFTSNEIERFDKCGWPIWNQMRWYWVEGADALVGAHFQSSSNSILVKDPERDHVAATEHYLDNLSTYFTPIRPIPLSSLRPQPPQKISSKFRSHLCGLYRKPLIFGQWIL